MILWRAEWKWEKNSHCSKEFDYPNPHHYTIEFPSDTDARIFAPIAWLLDWQTVGVDDHRRPLDEHLLITLLGRVIGLGRLATIATGMGLYYFVRCGRIFSRVE